MDNYRIRISAKCLSFDKEGRLLLVKSNQGDFWAAPGGGVEEGESLSAACRREVLEETGFAVKIKQAVFLQDYITKKHQRRNFETFFLGQIDESSVPEKDHDHEFKFFSQKEFSKIVFKPTSLNPFVVRDLAGIDYKTYLTL